MFYLFLIFVLKLVLKCLFLREHETSIVKTVFSVVKYLFLTLLLRNYKICVTTDTFYFTYKKIAVNYGSYIYY